MTKAWNKQISARIASGFTIAEVLVATLIVGMCIAGAMVAIGSATQLTSTSSQITKATLLAQEVRELSMNTDYDNILNIRRTDEAPCDSTGDPLAGYTGWTETITVTYLNPNDISATSAAVTDVARINVALSFDGSLVLQTSWLVVKDQP